MRNEGLEIVEEKGNWYFISCMLLGIVSMIGLVLVGNGTYLSIIGLVAGFVSLRELKKARWVAWVGRHCFQCSRFRKFTYLIKA